MSKKSPLPRASLRLALPLAIAALALVFAAFMASSALAGVQYKYEKGLSEELSKALPGEAFGEPFGLAFDSSGDLFVADPKGSAGEGIIDKFDSANAFQGQLGEEALSGEFTRGVAVSDESGHIYVGDSNHSEVFALNGAGEKLSQWSGANTPATSFGGGCCFVFTAVDNSPGASKGDIYVSSTQEGGKVDVFKAQGEDKEEGEYLRELEAPGGLLLGGRDNIAVNQTNGEVYVADAGHKVVDRFSSSGEYEAPAQIKGISPGKPFVDPAAVGVDSATGDVFVIDQEKGNSVGGAEVVDEFNAAGEFLTQIRETGENEPFQQPVALAVQQAGPHAGELYVSDAGKKTVDVFAVQLPEAPVVEGTGVTELTGDSVTLFGEIDPRGAPTKYHLEYGPCTSASTCATSPFGPQLPATDAGLAGEDFKTHTTESFQVEGLVPATTYHVRILARNSAGTTTGSEQIFTTQALGAPFELPDGRSWELVSPPDKHSGAVSTVGLTFGQGVLKAAANGSAVTYLAGPPTEASPEGNSGGVQVLSTRTPSGWTSRDVASPHEEATGSTVGAGDEYRFVSEDLSLAVVQPVGRFNPALSAEASENTAYLRTLGSCIASCYQPLVTGKAGFANVPAGTHFGEGEFNELSHPHLPVAEDATADGRDVILRSATPLVAGAPGQQLYEWSEGALKLVSVLPPNEHGEESPAPAGQFLEGQPILGHYFGLTASPGAGGPSIRGAVSQDGSRIFWEFGQGNELGLYVRDTALGQTLQVDGPEAGCPESECKGGEGKFQLASADGSRVFFTDDRPLTKDSGAIQSRLEPDAAPDLYECEIYLNGQGRLACHLRDLTPEVAGEAANVQGDVLGASPDGSAVYFVADGALGVAGAHRGTCNNSNQNPTPQQTCNLYVLHHGSPAKLVAVLSEADRVDWSLESGDQPTTVSPDGQWLSFMSQRSLTGYDNRDAVSSQPDAEIFLYDATAERLICASCDPTGARPVGVEDSPRVASKLPSNGAQWVPTGWVAALPPETRRNGLSTPTFQPRYLSDSGRVFFNSLDALVPEDVNNTGDVYEFEPSGAGRCGLAAGCVRLISSGTSPVKSEFLDASVSGDDVFFTTTQRLTSTDGDTALDVYDAHVCTSEAPCVEAVQAPPPCVTEASCKAAPAPQPAIFGAPASALFSGLGNPAPPGTKVVVKSLTRAQKLAKALKACRTKHNKKKRVSCERTARKRFGGKAVRSSGRANRSTGRSK